MVGGSDFGERNIEKERICDRFIGAYVFVAFI